MTQELTKTGVIYCRVSSKEQIENTSLESQERYCQEYAVKNGIRVLQVFVDRGESAKTADRPEFTRAIALCTNKKQHIDYFIVYKLDRFARNQDDHTTVRTLLKRSGTELRSVTEPINETPIGRAMEGVLSVFAEFDNNVRTERTKEGMLERIKQGVWVWSAPIGYYRPSTGSNIAPEPHNEPYIRLIFEEWAKGGYSYKSLTRFVSERGFRTRHGKKPCAQLIERILKNKIYCGIISIWDLRVEGTGTFRGIVSEELWNQCQKGYQGKARFETRTIHNPNFPLKKSICLVCRASFTGSYSTGRRGKKYAYYHHQKTGCSQGKFIPKETFEQLFIEYLNEVSPNSRYEKAFKAVMLDVWKSNFKKFSEDSGRIRKELDVLEQARLKVFDLHRQGTYNDTEFVEQKSILTQRIMEKSQLLAESRIDEFDMDEALNYCFQFVRSSAATWSRLQYPNNVRFQKMVFPEKLSFDGKKFGTTKLSSIYAINQEYSGKKSDLVAWTGRCENPFNAINWVFSVRHS